MTAPQNFRTAFNGFNREDVVQYIEFLNAKHAAEVSQLNSELEFLRGKLGQNQGPAEVPAPAAPSAGVDPLVEQQAARIRELFDENKALKEQLAAVQEEKALTETQRDAALADKAQAESQLTAALAAKAETAANLENALQQQNSFKSRMEKELEAYRRAERTDATVKVDDAASQIGELTDRVMNQLGELQNAVANSKQALRDAAATMYTIRPSTEE